MHELELLLTRNTCAVISRHLAHLDCLVRTSTAKVQINCAIKALDFILDEQRNLDVFVFEKLKNLLFHNNEVICVVATT